MHKDKKEATTPPKEEKQKSVVSKNPIKKEKASSSQNEEKQKSVVGENPIKKEKASSSQNVQEENRKEGDTSDVEEKKKELDVKMIIESFKAAMKEKEISPKWKAFTAIGLLSIAISLFQLVWFILWFIYKIVINCPWFLKSLFWLSISIIAFAFGFSRHVLLPIILILGNVWIFRDTIIELVVRIVKEKKGIILRQLTIDGNASNKPKRQMNLTLANFGLKTREDETEELLEFNTLAIDVSQPDKAQLKFDLDVELDGLQVNLVTYDMKFKDTNLSRFLASLAGGEEEEQGAQEVQKEEAQKEPEKKEQGNQEQRVNISITLTHVKIIAKHYSKQFGLRSLGAPMTIERESIDAEILGSKTKLFFWLNRFIVRQVVSGGFNIATSAVDGVGALATGSVGAVLGGVDKVADHVPGGSIIKGATGGTRKIVGGTVGGVSKITHGVAGGGKAIVGGITSGSVSGMKEGFQKAGNEVGGGLVGGLKDVGGGVAGAGGSVAGGFTKTAGMNSTTNDTKEGEDKTPPKRKSKSFNPFKKSPKSTAS